MANAVSKLQGPGLSKAAFIRRHPDAAAREVVQAAKKAGLKMKEQYVYEVRTGDRKRAEEDARVRGEEHLARTNAIYQGLAGSVAHAPTEPAPPPVGPAPVVKLALIPEAEQLAARLVILVGEVGARTAVETVVHRLEEATVSRHG